MDTFLEFFWASFGIWAGLFAAVLLLATVAVLTKGFWE